MIENLRENFTKKPNPWGFVHLQLHRNMAEYLQRTEKQPINVFPLDPIPLQNIKSWLENHQAMHDSLSRITGITSFDFLSLDMNNDAAVNIWLEQHFAVHQEMQRYLLRHGG
jgi:hypothetical protein